MKSNREYQEGLEQKILDYYENEMKWGNESDRMKKTEVELMTKIKTLEEVVEQNQEYQVGLEENILESHEKL